MAGEEVVRSVAGEDARDAGTLHRTVERQEREGRCRVRRLPQRGRDVCNRGGQRAGRRQVDDAQVQLQLPRRGARGTERTPGVQHPGPSRQSASVQRDGGRVDPAAERDPWRDGVPARVVNRCGERVMQRPVRGFRRQLALPGQEGTEAAERGQVTRRDHGRSAAFGGAAFGGVARTRRGSRAG